jgi:serine/threonine protein kinase
MNISIIYIAVCSLHDVVDRNNGRFPMNSTKIISLHTRIQWIFDILRGLIHLHYCRVIHRDIKLENILLVVKKNNYNINNQPTFTAKLGDFGLSVAKDIVSHCSTIGGEAKGTTSYMAPELYTDTNDAPIPYSNKSDIFALGIVIYDVLI